MTILLLQLPMASLTLPPLSLPCLTAYLRDHGFAVEQRDLGPVLMDDLFSEPSLEAAFSIVRERLEVLECRGHLDLVDAVRYAQLVDLEIQSAYLMAELGPALASLRRQLSSIDQREYRHAITVVDQAWLAVSVANAPFRLSRTGLSLPQDMLLAHPDPHDPCWAHVPLVHRTLSHVDASMTQCSPTVVGLTLTYRDQLPLSVLVAHHLRARYPTCHVVLGGHMVGAVTDLLVRDLDLLRVVDTVILGEGERPLLALAEALRDGRPTDAIPSTLRRPAPHGDSVASQGAEALSCNSLPTPVFDGLPLSQYLTNHLTLPLLSSRGCYHRSCTFCDHHAVYGGRYSSRRADMVCHDIERLQDLHGVDSIYFCDECMAPSFARSFSSKVIEAGLHISWMTELRAEEQLDDELLAAMARSGCRHLLFGVESASPRIAGLMGKGTRLSVIERVLQTCAREGILTHCFLIAGFPTESRAELHETFRFVVRNADSLDSFSFSPFSLKRGTPICRSPETFGITSIEERADGELSYRTTSGQRRGEMLEEVHGFVHDNPELHTPVARIDRISACFLSKEPEERFAEDSLLSYPTTRRLTRPPVVHRVSRSPGFLTRYCRFDVVAIRKAIGELSRGLARDIDRHAPNAIGELEATLGTTAAPRFEASPAPGVFIGHRFGTTSYYRLSGGLDLLLPACETATTWADLKRCWADLGFVEGGRGNGPDDLITMLQDIGYFDSV